MKKTLLIILLCTISFHIRAQFWGTQYFDGYDTIPGQAIFVIPQNPAGSSLWQVGQPSKVLFNSANTTPNALMTDTLNNYPPDTSDFVTFSIPDQIPWGILAVQWLQKIDFDPRDQDGGIVEYSVDSVNWINVVNDPYVYNYYGFDPLNQDTVVGGELGFVGQDTTWKNVWLCFDNSWIASVTDTLHIRFRFKSSAADNPNEGWMIDNLWAANTIIHTVKSMPSSEYMRVYPNPTSGTLHLEAQKLNEYHIIEKMILYDQSGKLVREYGTAPTKFSIELGDLPNGNYKLFVKTNKKEQLFSIVLNKNK